MRIPVLLLLLAACAPTTVSGRDGGRDSGAVVDTSVRPDVPGMDAPGMDAGSDIGPQVDASFTPSEGRAEVCGNGVDDDGNGRVDDTCECTVGTVRPCWLGPVAARGVGSCHDGQQACEPEGAVANWGLCIDEQLPTQEYLPNGMDDDCDGAVDEAGGLCLSSAQTEADSCGNARDDDCDTLTDCDDPDCAMNAACTRPCESTETLCWGEYDDDCDGMTDCDDPDCASNRSCHEEVSECEGAVYQRRDLGTRRGSSGIALGDGQAVMPRTCGDGRCGPGQVEVRDGAASLCVPPPEACPVGTHPTYANGVWRCDPPCELIVQYGFIYGFERRCAPRPDLDCPSGQVPTFVEGQEEWQCRPTCNNGQYDRVTLDGQLVCVPC